MISSDKHRVYPKRSAAERGQSGTERGGAGRGWVEGVLELLEGWFWDAGGGGGRRGTSFGGRLLEEWNVIYFFFFSFSYFFFPALSFFVSPPVSLFLPFCCFFLGLSDLLSSSSLSSLFSASLCSFLRSSSLLSSVRAFLFLDYSCDLPLWDSLEGLPSLDDFNDEVFSFPPSGRASLIIIT